jgi:hypothetical protein
MPNSFLHLTALGGGNYFTPLSQFRDKYFGKRDTVAKKAIEKRLAAAGPGDTQNPTAPIFARPLRAEGLEALDGQMEVAQNDVA